MFWVVLFAAAAVLALVVLVAYGVWLVHRLSDLWSEVRVVLDQIAQLGDLAASVGATGTRPGPAREADLIPPVANRDLAPIDVG